MAGKENAGKENVKKGKSRRGFASMDRELQKTIASKGGKAAHAIGKAHEFDSAEAREAGRKGGLAVSRNRQHMVEIGRKGGENRGKNAARSAYDPQGTQTGRLPSGVASTNPVDVERQELPR